MAMTSTITATLIGPTRPRPSAAKASSGTEMRNPPVMRIASPPYTSDDAMVARKECTFSPVMTKPLTVPSASPTSGAIAKPRTGSMLTATHAAVTDATPNMAPVERSKPPAMMTSVPAMAMIANGVFW